jgi:hypothetical protein
VTYRAILSQAHMADLTRHVARSAKELIVQNQSSAEPGSQSQEDHVLYPPTRPKAVLGQCARIRVVLESARHTELARQ